MNDGKNGDEASVQQVVPAAGTISNFFVRTHDAIGAGTYTFTISINGVPTALTCTIVANGQQCGDMTHTVSVVVGDLFAIHATQPDGTSFATTVHFTAKFAPS